MKNVLRIDDGTDPKFIKAKSPAFYELEDKFKADEKQVDIEEAN